MHRWIRALINIKTSLDAPDLRGKTGRVEGVLMTLGAIATGARDLDMIANAAREQARAKVGVGHRDRSTLFGSAHGS